MKHMRKEAPEWIFRWRRRPKDVPFAKWFALLAVTGGFAFLITSVRVGVAPPAPWAERRGSVIRVIDDAEGRALALRAQEGGPFLSRFEPSLWPEFISIEQAVFDAAGWAPPRHVPVLRDLPEEARFSAGGIATKGEPVFPKHPHRAPAALKTAGVALSPALYPLSGITRAMLPRELPAFDGSVDPAMEAEAWRFMLRLDSEGFVRDCVSLAGGDEAEAKRSTRLESWLRGIRFNPAPDQASRWIAVGIGFNQQTSDGTEY